VVPGRVLVSPARLALRTWERANASLVPRPQPIVDEQIYDSTVEALLAAIEETPRTCGPWPSSAPTRR
jgi:phosphohistidine phosphatase